MLTIRTEQLRALNAQVRQDLRDRLAWQYAGRAAEFGLDPRFLTAQMDEGLAECDRFHIHYKRDIELFLLTIFRHYGGFIPGPVAYPARALRFLVDTTATADERVRRFAEWTDYEVSRAAGRSR